jgi:hypothetical protein
MNKDLDRKFESSPGHQIGFPTPSHAVSPRIRGKPKRLFSKRIFQFFLLTAYHGGTCQPGSPVGNFAGNFDPVFNRDSNLGFEARITRMDWLTRQQGLMPGR